MGNMFELMIWMFALPTLFLVSSGLLVGFLAQSRRKQIYAASRQRFSSELLTLDEHIGFAEAEADPKRLQNVQQARYALDAAFQSHNQFFTGPTPKGVPVRRATLEVDQHLEDARRYLAAPAATSNEEIVAAAKELGRSVAALAKVGTAKLLATTNQELNRIHQDYVNRPTTDPIITSVLED